MYRFILWSIQTVLRLIGLISPRLAGRLSFRLFRDPAGRSKMRPGEEQVMDRAKTFTVEVNGKEAKVYHWGEGKPVLLVHGWESRASRFAPMIDKLISQGYQPIAFDAPGHGDSCGRSTTILEYQAIIREIERRHPNIEAVVGHSFGVLCSMYAIKEGLKSPKMIAISGVCEFSYLTDKFSDTLKLSGRTRDNLNRRVEGLFTPVTDIWQRFSASSFRFENPANLLIIHDKNDDVVVYSQATQLQASHSPVNPIIATDKLGHRQILMDAAVVDSVVDFIIR